MKSTLFAHQEQGITDLREALAQGYKRPVLQAPTAFGKTILAAAIVESALAKGNTVGFVVPFLTLIDQTAEKFQHEGIDAIGVMQAQHEKTDRRQPVQIISIDTLRSQVNRQHKEDLLYREDAEKEYPKLDVIIIDECHRQSKFLKQWLVDEPDQIFIGLSATPWSKGLGLMYDKLIRSIPMEDLIEQGFLSKYRVWAPKVPDLSQVEVSSTGEYKTKQASAFMSEDGLVSDIVNNWLNNGEGEPTICFCVDRLHAQTMSERFEAANVTAAYMDAFTGDQDRKEIFKRFADGRIKIICNVGVLTTGFDGDVRCLILARPVRSAILFVQMVGRGLRTAKGKVFCRIFDHSGNFHRLGFPEECGFDKLDTTNSGYVEAKAKGEADSTPCSKCGVLRSPSQKVPQCLACGHVPDPKSQRVEQKGDLVEVTDAERKLARQQMQLFYSGLLHICYQRKYKETWVGVQFKKRFGIYPPKYLAPIPSEPTDEVKRFETHQRIKFAKSRGGYRGKSYSGAR